MLCNIDKHPVEQVVVVSMFKVMWFSSIFLYPRFVICLSQPFPTFMLIFRPSMTFLVRLHLDLCSNAKDSTDAINRSLIALHCPFIAQSSSRISRLIDVQTRFHSLYTLDFLHRLNLINGQGAHHYHAQQKRNRLISLFAAPSGLTRQLFRSDHQSTLCSLISFHRAQKRCWSPRMDWAPVTHTLSSSICIWFFHRSRPHSKSSSRMKSKKVHPEISLPSHRFFQSKSKAQDTFAKNFIQKYPRQQRLCVEEFSDVLTVLLRSVFISPQDWLSFTVERCPEKYGSSSVRKMPKFTSRWSSLSYNEFLFRWLSQIDREISALIDFESDETIDRMIVSEQRRIFSKIYFHEHHFLQS